MASRWSVRYRSAALPFGEFGVDGFTELAARKVFASFVETCKATGGTVELKRGDEVVVRFGEEEAEGKE